MLKSAAWPDWSVFGAFWRVRLGCYVRDFRGRSPRVKLGRACGLLGE